MSNELAKLDKASQMLAEARTLDEILNIKDIAEAARAYAKAAKKGLEAQNYAAEIKIRAERKAPLKLCVLLRSIKRNRYMKTLLVLIPLVLLGVGCEKKDYFDFDVRLGEKYICVHFNNHSYYTPTGKNFSIRERRCVVFPDTNVLDLKEDKVREVVEDLKREIIEEDLSRIRIEELEKNTRKNLNFEKYQEE